MFLLDRAADGPVVTSASDLSAASKCEFAFLRQLDVKLGRHTAPDVAPDAMLKRAGELGGVHEARQLAVYRAQGEVVELAKAATTSVGLRAAAKETTDAFAGGASVVFQATFFDESDPDAPFVGFADFVVRQPDGSYRIQDTKLARSVKVTALLQLAAYHDQLTRLEVPVDDTVELLLGEGTTRSFPASELLPVYRNRRARLLTMVSERLATTDKVAWGDPRYTICGHCEHCVAEAEASRDLLLAAGMRLTQRSKLMQAGIATIDELAATAIKPRDLTLAASTYWQLHQQAALQVRATHDAPPPFDLFAPQVIADLPAPDSGDIYFDFEGDPLHLEDERWGIDYLFGWVDDAEDFGSLWAHDLEAEKKALLDFLAFVQERRRKHPAMHIYHYASYERSHLQSISGRHGVGEQDVDDLLRSGVLVDLYSVVRKCLRVGGSSYSIKKLEPLYMGDELRDQGGVTNAGDSVDEYVRAMEALDAGDAPGAQRTLDAIADYNRYDCVSTRRLRNWLYELAESRGVIPGAVREELDQPPFEPSPIAVALETLAEHASDEADARAYDLAAAAIEYHRREDKSFWWEHYARLTEPIGDWADARGVFVIDRVEVVADWGVTGSQRNQRRLLEARGVWGPGSGAPEGKAFALYAQPVPFARSRREPGSMLDIGVTIQYDSDEGIVSIEEICPTGEDTWRELPSALTPGPPPPTKNVVAAIEEWASAVVNGAGEWTRDPASDILTASAPRGGVVHSADQVDSVVTSLLGLESSYIAVQGPPGTGKTHLAAHVIAALVGDHCWRIGVVAQSHKVVENLLNAVVQDAGLPRSVVGKAAPNKSHYSDVPFTALPANGQLAFAAGQAAGYVIGGTVWDFVNVKRVGRKQLDLLVIDEAGQYSLANTIAASVSARNLLLLGDPQQLPQVSQGSHPAPVDGSALGFIADGRAVLPAELGFFLAESRRMDPALTAPVSRLSYDGVLTSHENVLRRHLAGVAPGLYHVPVEHSENSISSEAEAARVVRLVQELLGRSWTNPDAGRTDSPLNSRDFIVVTPYNAQLELIRNRLDAAGLPEVPVGTVDKFQGQEAAIAIVSLAASSPADVPRGISFLLSRNRLNVAISRAQWAAYLLYSPSLIEYLPGTPQGIAELSRFINLVTN